MLLFKTSWLALLVTLHCAVASNDKTNLRFTVEPPAALNFPHSSGARVHCVATGHPTPSVSWISGNDSSVVGQRGLHSVEPDGSLEFFPFRPDQYRADIHDAVYRCIATNSLGTIGSRDVKVKAVISGPAEVQVDDEYVSLRNTAVFRCHVHTPTGNHVTLSEWQTDDGMAFIADGNNEVNYGRYQIFRPGILHISNVTPTDAMKKYGCRMKNLLTGEIMKTTNFAKLILSETPEQYPPRFVEEPKKWTYQPNDIAYLPCVAHGNPAAQYRWYRLEGGRTRMVNLGSRAEVRDGTLILRRVTLADSGSYICVANNSFGQGRTERELVVTAPLRVEISPSRMCVSPGQEVLVNCSVSGGPVHGVFWVKDQKPLSALGSRIRQLSVKSIQLRSFLHEDSGFYQCYAFNEADSAQGVTEVCQRGEAPKFVNTFSKQLTMAGRGVSLACVANGWPTPQIRWLLDGSEIPDDGHVVFGDHVYKNNSVASYVNISSIKPQDGGQYKCTATNEMGTATHSGRIDILGPPVVRTSKNITIAASETVILTCPVSGYPIKEVIIERGKGSRRLPYNERHNVVDKGTVQIYGVRKEDEGIYRCIAHSGRGERAEGTLVLQVVSAPVISPFSFPSNLQEGMRISATCTVIAGDAPVHIRWTKDDNLVHQVGSEVEVLSLTDFVSSLIINKLSRRHTGNYTCSAVNSVSAVNFTSRMVVHAAPQWTIVPEEKMATAGSSVLFDCQAQGEPNPVVRWKREEDTKPPMYHNILSSPQMHVLENGSLHITTVSKTDQGYYLCEVTNGIGENLRSRVKLTVHNLPQVQSASHTVKGRRTEKTTLSCSASGDQPLTVTWRKDGVPIHIHGNSRYLNQENEKGSTKISRLILLSAEREDSALFTCIASNPFGEDKADLRVIIQEPPDSPSDPRPMDVTSSAITLTWTPPFNGNSPITSYAISYKNEQGQWIGNPGKEVRLSGEDTTITLTDLEPITTYKFQITAENALGASAPSRDLEVTTRKGAPRHPPEEVTVVALNSTAIKVSWKIPATLSDRPHLIDGFYIGYREAASMENYVYSTVTVNTNKNTEEFIISSLRRYSRYTVLVQAFNSEGAGPASEELAVQTYEFDPPGQPVLKLHSVTSSTIALTWEMPVDENPVSGFVLRYKESSSGWNEIQISELRSGYTVEALRCGAPYILRLTAFNNVGSGEPSNSVQVTTSGKAPIAPDKAALIRCNSTFVTCNLRSWLDNGCAITHFVIQYKATTERDWVLISNHILPSEEVVYLTDLLPGTWYDLLMNAQSDAGTTEAEFRFATLTASGATVPPMAMSTATSGPFFEDPTILVPIICAIVVLIVIIVVTAVVLAWKRRDAAETSEVCSGNSGGRADEISMCSYGKVKGGGGGGGGGGGNSSIYQPQREPLYFPSPYAASHVSGGGALASDAHHRHITSGFSGSLRRHQGSRLGEHVYDIPQRPQQRSDLQCAGHQYSRLWTTRPSGLRLPLVGDNEKKECQALVMSNTESEICRQSLGMYYHSDLSESPSADEVGCLATRIDTQEASDLDGFSETECDRDHTINRRSVTQVDALQRQGPRFILEPPNRVDFLNSTGVSIPCSAEGNPTPAVTWMRQDGVTLVDDVQKLRQVRADGSMVFQPFKARDYRQDVHSAVYRCVAENVVGSIISREVKVRAAVHQFYETQVYNEFVINGNTAVFRCHLPSFVKEYVTVVAWIRDDGLVIKGDSGGRYSVFPSGELHIRQVDSKSDSSRQYYCQTKHRISGEVKRSVTAGKLIITEPHINSSPRITDRRAHISVVQGKKIELPCSAHAFPPPSFGWFRRDGGVRLVPVQLGGRIQQVEGTLIFQKTQVRDAGKYVCVVNNSVGEDKGETELIVTASLAVSVSPRRVVAEEGQSIDFNCSVTGHPIRSIVWLKNHRPLVVGGRLQLVSKDKLRISHVLREDKGMYQCLAVNDWESTQGTAELKLGDDPPVFSFTFAEQTLEPGPSVSLKCAATGNPLPQITWTLDGTNIADNLRVRVGDFVTSDGYVNSFVNISSLRTEDGGRYQCQATNEVAAVFHEAKINVFGRPYIRPMENRTVLGGSTLVLHCPVAGYPIQQVYWEKGGSRLPHSRRQTAFPNGTIVIEKVDRSMDEGNYQCSATNSKGEKASGTTHVMVQVAPSITSFSFPTNLRKGLRITVTCSVLEGDSPITITWFKDGQRISRSESDIVIESSNEFSSTLFVKEVDFKHNGNYTCLASNLAAKTNFTAPMVVNVPPEWRITPTDTSVVTGQTVVIDCQAEGFPQPRIWWENSDGSSPPVYRTIISNSHIHTLENGSLMIREAEESDSGFYLCQASNGVGTGLSKVIKVNVHVAAHFRSPFHTVTLKIGDAAKLPCRAFGERPITFVWRKERTPLDTSKPRMQISISEVEDGMLSEVNIETVERHDSSTYTCIASNGYGEDERNIQLIVQEAPDVISGIHAKEVTSRSITITWSPPFNGNSPITAHKIEYRAESESWSSKGKVASSSGSVTLPGSESSFSIRGLKPVTNYQIRISSENALGWSRPSQTVHVSTGEEAPEGPPTAIKASAITSRTVRITWQPPKKEHRNGNLKGYYLGYRIKNSPTPYNYRTIEIGEGFKEEAVIATLRRASKYSIVVQAFNSKGSGPPSDEIVIETLENDPPAAVVLSVEAVTTSSIHLQWNAPAGDNPPVSGYILYSHKESETWDERQMAAHQTSYTYQDLNCGCVYEFYIVAFNGIGKSKASQTVASRTQGGASIAPDKDSFIEINSTSILLQLSAWQTNGCPIKYFVVQYKGHNQKEWILVSNNIIPDQKTVLVTDLSPATWYTVLVVAHTDAGPTEAEYILATLTMAGAPPFTAMDERRSALYRSLGIVVPGTCAIVVLSVIFVVACVVVRKRRRHDNTPVRECRLREEKSCEGMNMSVLDRKPGSPDTGSLPKDQLYYPSPYATSRVMPGSHKHMMEGGESSQSMRRTIGRREHIYEVPYPPPKWEEDEDSYSHIMESSSVPLHPSHNLYQTPRIMPPLPVRPPVEKNPVRLVHATRSPYRHSSLTSEGHSGEESDSEGTTYTFHGGQHAFRSFGDSHELSEAECDRDQRDPFGKPQFNQNEADFRRLHVT